MSETENGNGQAIEKAQPRGTFGDILRSRKNEIAGLTGSILSPDRLVMICIQAHNNSEYLQKCSASSLIRAVLQAAKMGLEPDGEVGALVPMRNKDKWEAQFWPMAKGLCARAYDDPTVAAITPRVIREGDYYEIEAGSVDRLVHRPDRQCVHNPVIAAYCILKMRGEVKWDLMWREEIDAIMNKSPAARSGSFTPWQSHWDEMAKKTVVKRLLKTAPIKSARLAVSHEIDHDNDADIIDVGPEVIDPPKAPPPPATKPKRIDEAKAKMRETAPPKVVVDAEVRKPTTEEPKMITDEQKTRLLNMLDKMGKVSADQRLAAVGSVLDIPNLQAIGALTAPQAEDAIDILSGAREMRKQEAARAAAGEEDPAIGNNR